MSTGRPPLDSADLLVFKEEQVAQPYFDRLSQIIGGLGPLLTDGATLEIKHFFSGAALYANGKICVTLSPAGFALKLPPDKRQRLINERKGREIRFFAKGPIKREYAALSDSVVQDEEMLQELVEMCVSYAVGALGSNSLFKE